jgi:hypothetical protein
VHAFSCKVCSYGKGPEKNTKKALHTKLLNRKNVKLQGKERKGITLKSFGYKMNQKK